MGQAGSDMNCMVGKGLLGPKEATAGTCCPWVGVTADVLDPEHRGALLPTEADAKTLVVHRCMECCIELIEKR